MSKKYKKTFAQLLKWAEQVPPVKSSRIVAAVLVGGRIISVGNNSYKTHPFQKKYCKNPHAIHLHAEVGAIVNALKAGYSIDMLKDSTVLVARSKLISNTFVPGLAKPCIGCQRCLADFGIKSVYYTTETDEIEKLGE